ncbi:MAG: hypothetical protein M3N07_10070, partial [Pseudomonadota bacterium]|nr:hypothetical protein [Pseudomonadota bacterium]
LKRLDVGHGYTPDGGASWPLRGAGIGAMPTAEEVLYGVQNAQVIFSFRGSDPADADALAAEFARAGFPIGDRFGFTGGEAVIARMRALAPNAWTFTRAESERCLADYRLTGWLGIMPESCRGRAVALTPGANWTVWGWPYRFLERLIGAGGRAFMVDGFEGDGTPRGLATAEQLGEVPRHFRGYLWVADMERAGRAYRR